MSGPLLQRGVQRPVRVLVVADAIVQRSMLVALLDADAEIEVVGQAAGGADAIGQAATLRPDVIALDLRMAMDGLETARRIMQQTPTPIVMVTASLSDGSRHMAFAAFQAGAVASVAQPRHGTHDADAADELRRTVKNMAQVRVIRRWAPERLRPAGGCPTPAMTPPAPPLDIVAIGASTGGPVALREILTGLPARFPLPVLVVQHIDADFVSPLVDWLKPQCALPLGLATAGQALDRPGIYVAPANQHLIVRGRALALTDGPPLRGHRPSVTILFESVAAHYGGAAAGVLLTGMGDDGATGLRDLKGAGGVTIAQDEASSVVFGMPAAAISLGVVDYALPPSRIAPLLMKLAGCDQEGGR